MNIGTGVKLAWLGVTLSLCTACGAEAGHEAAGDDQLDSVGQSLDGQVTFGNQCTTAMRTRIQEGVDLIVARLFSQELTSCLKDAYLFMHDEATPEAIVARFKEKLPTHVNCFDQVCGDDDAAGCAGGNATAESLDLSKWFLAIANSAEVAAVISHEIAHNKGWGHPVEGHFDYGYTVPEQVKACVQFDSPNGLDRSAAPGEAELARVGGGGGLPFESGCPSSTFVRGIRGDSSSWVNRIGLNCDNGAERPRVGSFMDSTRSGSYDCAANEVVVGVWGTSSHYLDQLGVRCASRAAVATSDASLASHDIWIGGGTNGLEFDRTCPTGMAVKRVYGRAGARIDQLGIVCESVSAAPRIWPMSGVGAGSQDGTTRANLCSGFGVMTSLYGRSGGAVDRLGGFCRATTLDSAGMPVIGGNPSEHLIEAVGGPGGHQGTKFGDGDFAWKDSCSAGRALVGMNVRVGSQPGQGITQVQGVCALPSEWGGGGSATRTFTPARGGGSGTLQALECPSGRFLVGMQVWAKKTVHATATVQKVSLICRPLVPSDQ